jgi:formylglycine-generating enzyme required for sulfatase activity
MELEPGSYHVEVAAEGYETKRQWIDLEAGHEEQTRFKLERIIFTNNIGMKFVLIPAGKFTMGSPPDEQDRFENEKQHEVRISKPFYLQNTEVSQGQWKKVMGDNPSHFEDCGDDCPVEKVSWLNAQEFINKLNHIEGSNKYRLPTEAEWEYACRANTKTAYSFGDEVDKLDQYAWYSANSEHQTQPVGKKKPNDWGLYDMHGNVWEWVEDWYGDYPSNSVIDPKGPDRGKRRVLRGGSWYLNAWNLRSAYRSWYNPELRRYLIGFRVARDF